MLTKRQAIWKAWNGPDHSVIPLHNEKERLIAKTLLRIYLGAPDKMGTNKEPGMQWDRANITYTNGGTQVQWTTQVALSEFKGLFTMIYEAVEADANLPATISEKGRGIWKRDL